MSDQQDKAVVPAEKPARYEFQDRDGTWHPFLSEKHYNDTVADGRWPIRALYTHQQVTAELAQDAAILVQCARDLAWDDSEVMESALRIENAMKGKP